ncbi:MAG: bifunctional UDP-N-acetylglucosamine diphosphorylase/glucosamine-1-phosphate N-acetyltransferase GlmU [Fusobacteria bacterium]|nr:bifunctional UDP-N-acetylglucosamine diphosphorylase/glucosamine-1-phosphate N-acetyltransferase GlmU [Fusobacteriota bacterium]
MKINGIVLAAGKGTRMKSKYSKVLHSIIDKPILAYVTDRLRTVTKTSPIVVIGHGGSDIKEYFGDSLVYRVQREQLGTGDAVKSGVDALSDEDGVFVLCGDTPLLDEATLRGMLELFIAGGYGGVVLTAVLEDSTGYGRIIKDGNGDLLRIVEEKDASIEEKLVKEINSGAYIFNRELLVSALALLKNNNAQGEYYLTDILEIMRNKGEKVGTFQVEDSDEILGINNRVQLEEATRILRKRVNERAMLAGATVEDSASVYLGEDVIIGKDVVIGPNVRISGKSIIEDDVIIGPNCIIEDSFIGQGTNVVASVILDSQVGADCNIGPFAYLRPLNSLGDKVKVGDFVELKKSIVGSGSKIPHHSYIGDSVVGEGVNIGAGTITCNYDGVNKHQTIIEDGAFIGSNTNLVAPVRVGREAYIGAGSTITSDVPEGALGLERNKLKIIENWKDKK